VRSTGLELDVDGQPLKKVYHNLPFYTKMQNTADQALLWLNAFTGNLALALGKTYTPSIYRLNQQLTEN
jgi:hypothetical protein